MLNKHADPANELISYLQQANAKIGTLEERNEKLEQEVRENRQKVIVLEERQKRIQKDTDKSFDNQDELDEKIENLEKKMVYQTAIASVIVGVAVFVASTIGGAVLENWVTGYLEENSAIQYSILD